MPRSTKTAASTDAPAPRPTRRRAAAGKAAAAPATAPAPKSSARAGAKKSSSVADQAAAPDRFLNEQRALLLAEREAYQRQADALREEAEQMAAEMEPGDVQFDEESGEGGTMSVERERDLTLSAQARIAIDEIDRALAKIDSGRYGSCEQCGSQIPKARLKALPYAALCVGCKSGRLSRR
jgi:DnaK suppressor protein